MVDVQKAPTRGPSSVACDESGCPAIAKELSKTARHTDRAVHRLSANEHSPSLSHRRQLRPGPQQSHYASGDQDTIPVPRREGSAPPEAGNSRHRKGDTKTMIDVHPFHFLLPPQGAVLFRFALKLAADETRAEDLVQETFLKAWANRDSFTRGTELRGWLFTILRNTFYSSLRKHRREVQDVDGRLAALLVEEAAQEHSADLNKLISVMATLPEIHRRPVVLMGAYGFSQQEAADACNCAVGTIKSRVSRGRSELGRAFGRDPLEPHGTITRPGRGQTGISRLA